MVVAVLLWLVVAVVISCGGDDCPLGVGSGMVVPEAVAVGGGGCDCGGGCVWW